MSHPYIIWTMRRTGGTTLAMLLSRLTEHPGCQHEPFNPDRKFGYLPTAFDAQGDGEQLRLDLWGCLSGRPVLKHCYELMTPDFNQALFEVTTQLGYRHIILDRRQETDRILSLELAQLTGAWGGEAADEIYPAIEAGEVVLPPLDTKRAAAHMTLCHLRRQQMQALCATANPAPFVVYFEDVYTDPAAGRALIGRILAFVEITPADHAAYEQMLSDALLQQGQNSARILKAVPNAQTAVARLEQLRGTHEPVFAAS